MPYSSRFFIFLLIIFSACSPTETKPEPQEAIKQTPLVIKKEGIVVYQLQKSERIDSLLFSNQQFIDFKNSIEDLSKLNRSGLGPFLLNAINSCNKLLKEPLSEPFNTPDVRSRLKVVKTQLLKARFYSKERMQKELNETIENLYVAYTAYLKRVEDFSKETETVIVNDLVAEEKSLMKTRR